MEAVYFCIVRKSRGDEKQLLIDLEWPYIHTSIHKYSDFLVVLILS